MIMSLTIIEGIEHVKQKDFSLVFLLTAADFTIDIIYYRLYNWQCTFRFRL